LKSPVYMGLSGFSIV